MRKALKEKESTLLDSKRKSADLSSQETSKARIQEQLKLVQNRETPLTLMEFVNAPVSGVKLEDLNDAGSFCVPHTDSQHSQVCFID